jgi:4-hydroxy-tetrahydrodipicolinate reductase
VRVGVAGAGGNVGREICRAVDARDGMDLVAAVDPACGGQRLAAVAGVEADGLRVATEAVAFSEAGCSVVVDFTRADAVRSLLPALSAAGIHAVVGTTGLGPADMDEIGALFAGPDAGCPNAVVAANFAIGAVLLMRFAELAAPWFDGAEIVELHHDGKVDAPSGTAMATAARIAEGRTVRGPFPDDRTVTTVSEGARGGRGPAGVRIHSVRLPGLVAHEEVLFGAVGQSLTLRHDSYDRTSFVDGVLLAVTAVAGRPGLTVGLDPLLGL